MPLGYYNLSVQADKYGVDDTHVKTKENKENVMLTIIILLALLIVFDITALRWGFDSTDGINSLEWIHRHLWDGFH